MAKKSVGKVKSHGAAKMAQLICAVRSPKSGAYTFPAIMIAQDKVEAHLDKLLK